MARGRPHKTVLSDDDKFEEVFFKAFTPKLDANGNLVFVPSEASLTLDECQILIGRETRTFTDTATNKTRILEPKKYSLMGIQKMTLRALAKAKSALKMRGIHDISDCFEPDMNVPAKACRESSDY